LGKEQIAKANPVVKGEKLEKIWERWKGVNVISYLFFVVNDYWTGLIIRIWVSGRVLG
jgi:hypothetical protein